VVSPDEVWAVPPVGFRIMVLKPPIVVTTVILGLACVDAVVVVLELEDDEEEEDDEDDEDDEDGDEDDLVETVEAPLVPEGLLASAI